MGMRLHKIERHRNSLQTAELAGLRSRLEVAMLKAPVRRGATERRQHIAARLDQCLYAIAFVLMQRQMRQHWPLTK